MWPRRLSATQRQGQLGEERALAFLLGNGLRLVQANFSCSGGEIDLIMRDGATLVFVEVRERNALSHGGAAASITRAKKRRIICAAETYLQRCKRLPPCRIDVVAIDSGELEWLQDAIQV